MDITRYHVFLVGVVLVLLGLELRFVDSFVLTPKATRFFAEQMGFPIIVASNAVGSLTGVQPDLPSKVLHPPEWLSWFLLSLGFVLVLQSWTIAKTA